jgi:hypothetical protein
MKSQQDLAPQWKWSSDRRFKVTIHHRASTPRDVGALFGGNPPLTVTLRH